MFKRLTRGIESSTLAGVGSVVIVSASMLVNASNFIFHLVVSRKLDPASYGALGALLGLLLLFAVPASALQVAITKEVVQWRARQDSESEVRLPIVVGPLFAQSLMGGAVFLAVLLALAPFLKSFLHLPSLTSAILLAVYVVPSALGLVPRGVLLGEMRFRRVATALALGAFVRLVLAITFTGHSGVNGALAATVMGELVTTVVLLPSLRPSLNSIPGVEPLHVHWSDGAGALVAFSGYWALTGIDTLLVRHFLSGNDSGYYSAAANAARIAMFLPAAIGLIALPSFAVSSGRSLRARSALIHALSIVSVISMASALVLAIFPKTVIDILFSSKYAPAAGTLRVLAFGAAALGMVNILMQYHLAARARLAAALPWVGVVVAGVGITTFHDSIESVAAVMVITSVLLLIWMAQLAFSRTEAMHGIDGLSHTLWEVKDPSLDLTMVIPYFNPGASVVETVQGLDATLRRMDVSFEIITVSDGSTDGSDELLEQLHVDSLRRVVLPQNAGKGQAVRTGLAMGEGRYLGFIDADGDVDPSLLEQYIALARLYEPDVILGSKRHPLSAVHYPLLRHVYSIGYQLLTYVLFHLNVRDTQTGLKLVRRDVLSASLPVMVVKRFAFDLELLVVAKHLGFGKFFEAPIKIEHHFTSTVSVKSIKGMLIDTFGIFYRLRLLHAYDYDIAEFASEGTEGEAK